MPLDLIRGWNRFSEKIVLKWESSTPSALAPLTIAQNGCGRLRGGEAGRNTLTKGWGVGGEVSVIPFANLASEHHGQRRHHHDADRNRHNRHRIEVPAVQDACGKSGAARVRIHQRTVGNWPLMTAG